MINTINLPVESVVSIINIDDSRVNVPVNTMLQDFDEKHIDKFRSIYATFEEEDKADLDNLWKFTTRPFDKTRRWPVKRSENFGPVDREWMIKCRHFINTSVISNLVKKPVIKTHDITFFELTLKYRNDVEQKMIVPSYCKFYSTILQSFIPVEFLKTAKDVLLDYTNDFVQIVSIEKMEKFEFTDYYTFTIISDKIPNFFLNGVLSYIPYNEFEMKN